MLTTSARSEYALGATKVFVRDKLATKLEDERRKIMEVIRFIDAEK